MTCASKDFVEIVKNCVEISAYVAALLFFIYKVYAGYLITDMSIAMDCERKKSSTKQDRDNLSISVALKKGERGGCELHDAQVRVTSCSTGKVLGPLTLTSIFRINRTEATQDPAAHPGVLRAELDWTHTPKDVPRLNMPPGDETKLGAYLEVDSGDSYMVEAVVLARRLLLKGIKLRFGQWRATKVSLPV